MHPLARTACKGRIHDEINGTKGERYDRGQEHLYPGGARRASAGRGPRFTPVSTPTYPSVGYVYDDMRDLDGVFGNEREGYVYPQLRPARR